MSERWTIRRVLDWTKGYLAEKGIDNARLETEWLLAESLGLDRVGLYVNYDKPLTDGELAAVRGLVARRAKREPLQYVLGSQEFAGLDFLVTPAVLIPRHDSEVLLAESLRVSPQSRTVLDIGTGSGCLAVALAKQMTGASVTAVDLSADALAIARQNAEQNGATVEFCQGSLLEPVVGRQFDLIVSNPPYIPTPELAALQAEFFRRHPQAQALGLIDRRALEDEVFDEALHDQATELRAFASRPFLLLFQQHLPMGGASKWSP